MSATVSKNLSKKLPSKPSAMIRLALHDVAVVLKEKKARINMNIWMRQRVAKTLGGKPGVCEVCFGGAVMLQTLKINPLVHGSEDAFSQPNVLECNPTRVILRTTAARKIVALDHFRCGSVVRGLREMGVPVRKWIAVDADGLNHMEVPSFKRADQFPEFRRAMQKMARALERHDL